MISKEGALNGPFLLKKQKRTFIRLQINGTHLKTTTIENVRNGENIQY